ncbi:MAG: cytochrome C oxidase subunit III [Campylobacter sp.]|nr:cytochrome C oxidase subunit III [Campylobacter sp.]
MRILIFLSIFLVSVFAEDFITKEEYGAMLYKNPRGIGCDKCHGKKGEGGLIATYKEQNATGEYVDINLIAPPINKISLQELADGVTRSKGVMPSYFLTEDEIITLFKFIKDLNKEKK